MLGGDAAKVLIGFQARVLMFEDMINTQTDDKERKGNIAVVAAACCMVLLAFLVVGLKVRGDNLKQVLLF